jgi:hypothetical protein
MKEVQSSTPFQNSACTILRYKKVTTFTYSCQHHVTGRLCNSSKLAYSFPNMNYLREMGRMGAHLHHPGNNHSVLVHQMLAVVTQILSHSSTSAKQPSRRKKFSTYILSIFFLNHMRQLIIVNNISSSRKNIR